MPLSALLAQLGWLGRVLAILLFDPLPAPAIPRSSVLSRGSPMLKFDAFAVLPDPSYRYRLTVTPKDGTPVVQVHAPGEAAEVAVPAGAGTVGLVVVDGGGNAISLPASEPYTVLPAPAIPAFAVVADPPA